MDRALVCIVIVLCLSSCTPGGDGADAQEGGAADLERVVAEPISVDELVMEIRRLGNAVRLQGDCIDRGTSTDNSLGAYFRLALKVSATPDEVVMEAYDVIASASHHSVHDNAAKLMIINRLVFDVPSAFLFVPPNEKPEDDLGDDEFAEHYRNDPTYPYMYVGVPGSIRFWLLTPFDDMELNYLYPLEYDEAGRICMTSKSIDSMQTGAELILPTDEYRYFMKNYRRRDLTKHATVAE